MQCIGSLMNHQDVASDPRSFLGKTIGGCADGYGGLVVFA
jgi:hypothetical protein